jgi:hypothetical protein
MWRIVLGATLVLSLALGGVAAACPSCGAATALESVKIEGTDTAQTLVLTVRPLTASVALPESGTAVVMFFNGNRAKCINSPIRKAGVDSSGLATYRGDVPNYYGGSRGQVATYTGRVEIAGDVYEFSVATDGTPGTARIVTDGTSVTAVAATPAATQTVVTAAPVATTAPTLAPAAVSSPQPVSDPWTPVRQPITLLAALALVATLAGAYVDRRRALARATA